MEIVAVFAILTLWRKKYSRFVPDNNHSVFHMLVDATDSIFFIISGKKNALHVRAFAEMEVKILVCHILRSFSLHSLDSRDQVHPLIPFPSSRLNPPASSFDADNSERFFNCPFKT
ncbi:hypothetical protein CDAR_398731 [Caerostris darwini]|uniref:Uncharacterized protein n=1 Tax=Caerostris darwini TaxID=1538125 RepID=A0AAV4T060_9ARAC|nr:hypothetical protein CDAR_398731 [Caerostris darwini]